MTQPLVETRTYIRTLSADFSFSCKTSTPASGDGALPEPSNSSLGERYLLGCRSSSDVKLHTAYDLRRRSTWACKTTPPALGQVSEAALREVAVMSSLSGHPAIQQFGEYFIDSRRCLSLISEHLRGKCLLDTVLGLGAIAEADVQKMAAQVLQAVYYMHSQGIAHRDIKLSSLRLAVSGDFGSVKLTGFGQSALLGPDGYFRDQSGSPLYVAPEVFSAERYDLKCDIWSVGVVICALLAGKMPASISGMANIRAGDCSFEGAEWESISPAAKAFLARLMCIDPASRVSASDALGDKWLQKFA